jgi:transcriptional regulator with XRE-family HTH domain
MREDNDWLQKHVAKLLNVSQQAYSCYELGTRDIPTEILISLANIYKTSTDYILDLTNNPNPYARKNGKH